MESVLFASTLDQEEAIVARMLKPIAHEVLVISTESCVESRDCS